MYLHVYPQFFFLFFFFLFFLGGGLSPPSPIVEPAPASSRYVRCCVRVERAAYFKACFKAGACIKWSWIRVWRAYACQDSTSSEVRTLIYQYIGANLRRCAYTCIHLGRGLDEHSLSPSFSSFSPLFFFFLFYAKKWGGGGHVPPPPPAPPLPPALLRFWSWKI